MHSYPLNCDDHFPNFHFIIITLSKYIPGKFHTFLGPVYMEKFLPDSRVEWSLTYPSYAGQANFSYISLQNAANRLHEKKAVGYRTDCSNIPVCC